MKKKQQLEALLAKLKDKISEAFDTFIETSSEEDIKKYEALVAQSHKIEEEIALLEKEELEEKGKPKEIEETGRGKNPLEEERVSFGKKICEAMALGTTFSGLLPRQSTANIQAKKENIAKIRGLCTIHQATGDYTVYVEGDDATVNYVGENSSITESTPTITPIGLSALKLAALVKVSREYAADLAADVMGYIEDKLSKAFAVKEDTEILFGAGSSSDKTKLRGIATGATNVVTAASETTVTWAEVKKLIQALKAYRANATLVCGQAFLDIVHEFKDGNTYMFPQGQEITHIYGVRVVVSDVFPTLASEAVAAVVGDFSYYHLLERQGIEVVTLTERFADTDQVGVRAVERIDGDFVADAFAVLKMKKTGV